MKKESNRQQQKKWRGFPIKRRSFRDQLVAAFCLISIVPLILVQMISYYNISNIMQGNVDELVNANLVQTQKGLQTMLSSYEDLLYQLYTDDTLVDQVAQLNEGTADAMCVKRLRNTLHGLANTKSYVQSITLITKSGQVVFYDKITGSSTKHAWLDLTGDQSQSLYEKIAISNDTKFFPTQLAAKFSAQSYYVFHIAHRIIDYRDIVKQLGVVILSIDEELLSQICNESVEASVKSKTTSVNFIMDRNGQVLSFPDKQKIGEQIPIAELKRYGTKLVKSSGILSGDQISVHMLEDEKIGWSVVNAADQSQMLHQISDQQKLTILVLMISVFVMTVIIIFQTKRLTHSIHKVVGAMKTAGKGQLSIQVEKDKKMPAEIVTIADQFNSMIRKIDELLEEIQAATQKQKNAEIAALEAQINPHFLYNILDTINWMAIDQDQYEISNAINALGRILRYGIDKSNSVVEIRKETEWLKQYIFLQQTRLKNTFACHMNISPNVMEYHIHKLLFQPFIENAILHGFEGVKGKHELTIAIEDMGKDLKITIADNGKGMEQHVVDALLSEHQEETQEDRSHIGVRNAVGRLKMYYGEQAKVKIQSEPFKGTRIVIRIPKL